jgi:hypothetical protein
LAWTVIVLAALLAGCNLGDIDSLPEATPSSGTSSGSLLSSGISTNVPKSAVTADGWTLCYQETYNISGTSLGTIQTNCSGGEMLLACSALGAPVLDVAAAGLQSDVLFFTSADTTSVHNANGVDWYYHNNYSWGFAVPGDTINKAPCDTASGAFPGEKLCWYTFANMVGTASGSRCGVATNISAPTHERLIYAR